MTSLIKIDFWEGGFEMRAVIDVSPVILEWVMHQMPPETKPENRDLLEQWLLRKKVPTSKTVMDFCKNTHIPFGYFFLKKPPEEECALINCRTIGSKSSNQFSRDAIDTINTMTNIKDWMSEYIRDIGFDKLHFVGSFQANSADASIVAQDIRKKSGIEIEWYSNVPKKKSAFDFLRKKFSDLGILVMKSGIVGENNKRHLRVQEFRAFALVDDYAPLIFINNNDTNNGKLFSLFHEVAHIWIGNDDVFNDHYLSSDISDIEIFCNKVAAEIIVPAEIFKKKWYECNDDINSKIQWLSSFFKCSDLVIARRALDFGFIDAKTYSKIQQEVDQVFKNKPEHSSGGSYFNTLCSRWDSKIISALDNSTKSGRTEYLEAYRLTGLKAKNFHRLVDEIAKDV